MKYCVMSGFESIKPAFLQAKEDYPDILGCCKRYFVIDNISYDSVESALERSSRGFYKNPINNQCFVLIIGSENQQFLFFRPTKEPLLIDVVEFILDQWDKGRRVTPNMIKSLRRAYGVESRERTLKNDRD